jgi:TPR repeat protein
MDVRKVLLGITLSLLLTSGVAFSADYNKGLKAAQLGDFETALAEWAPLAEQGDAETQYNLGAMYKYGNGVLENDKTAVKWYTLAAEQGHASAQFNLGLMYYKGRGALGSYRTAASWFTKAAGQGHDKAQGVLGEMYSNGEGVVVNNIKAYMWVNLAAYNTSKYSKHAGKIRGELAKKMTPADISKAQDMSSLCLESNYKDC